MLYGASNDAVGQTQWTVNGGEPVNAPPPEDGDFGERPSLARIWPPGPLGVVGGCHFGIANEPEPSTEQPPLVPSNLAFTLPLVVSNWYCPRPGLLTALS